MFKPKVDSSKLSQEIQELRIWQELADSPAWQELLKRKESALTRHDMLLHQDAQQNDQLVATVNYNRGIISIFSLVDYKLSLLKKKAELLESLTKV